MIQKVTTSRTTELRRKAAQSFRAARNSADAKRGEHETTARGYKSLAAAEEWLGGVPQRSANLPWLPRSVIVKA
jgi:hypothetical protein